MGVERVSKTDVKRVSEMGVTLVAKMGVKGTLKGGVRIVFETGNFSPFQIRFLSPLLGARAGNFFTKNGENFGTKNLGSSTCDLSFSSALKQIRQSPANWFLVSWYKSG